MDATPPHQMLRYPLLSKVFLEAELFACLESIFLADPTLDMFEVARRCLKMFIGIRCDVATRSVCVFVEGAP
jgi:hypothetical protein